jgi:hypothetical protein
MGYIFLSRGHDYRTPLPPATNNGWWDGHQREMFSLLNHSGSIFYDPTTYKEMFSFCTLPNHKWHLKNLDDTPQNFNQSLLERNVEKKET